MLEIDIFRVTFTLYEEFFPVLHDPTVYSSVSGVSLIPFYPVSILRESEKDQFFEDIRIGSSQIRESLSGGQFTLLKKRQCFFSFLQVSYMPTLTYFSSLTEKSDKQQDCDNQYYNYTVHFGTLPSGQGRQDKGC